MFADSDKVPIPRLRPVHVLHPAGRPYLDNLNVLCKVHLSVQPLGVTDPNLYKTLKTATPL